MTISITATVEPSNVPPRIRLDISGTTETSVTPLRLHPDGRLVPVRTSDGNPEPLSGGVAVLYDYEAPFGDLVQYTSVETPSAFTLQVMVDASQVWLIHPGVPSLSLPIRLGPGSLSQDEFDVQQGVFYPLGRANPVVVTGGARQAAASQVVALTTSDADYRAIRDLVSDAGVLYLNVPVELGYSYDSCYIAVGKVTATRAVDKVFVAQRAVAMPFVVVDRPAGGSQAQRTLADLLDYPTLAALQSAYATLLDVETGP